MARNRMLNPEFFLDEELSTVSAYARLLYQGLWGICDDVNATFPNKSGWIKAQIFPYNAVNIEKLLSEIHSIGKIVLFKDKENEFWFVKNFSKHQRVDHPSKSKYPQFINKNVIKYQPSVNPREDSESTQGALALNRIEVKGIEKKLNPVPKTAGIGNYLETLKSRSSKNPKIHSSAQLLASEIHEWSGRRLVMGALMANIKRKGEEFVRKVWAETKQSKADDPPALFMFKLKSVKINLVETKN